MAKRRHATLARFEGAATGVGGIVTLVPDLARLAWIQSRLVFFIAAAYGYDPHDPMRPAELLVLMRPLRRTSQTARAALDGDRQDARRGVHRLAAAARGGARAPAGEDGRQARGPPHRRAAIPVFAIAFNAVANERDTRALADRAIQFWLTAPARSRQPPGGAAVPLRPERL